MRLTRKPDTNNSSGFDGRAFHAGLLCRLTPGRRSFQNAPHTSVTLPADRAADQSKDSIAARSSRSSASVAAIRSLLNALISSPCTIW